MKRNLFVLSSLLALLPSVALADDRLPGQVVLDEVDSISEADHQKLVSRVKNKFPEVRVEETDLVTETKQRILHVDPEHVDSVIKFLVTDGRVQHVEPNFKVYATFVPNDPLYAKQWHMKQIGMEKAWNYTAGLGATVAVIDTGIACVEHDGFSRLSDLSAECVPGYNFVDSHEFAYDDHGHGTHVAGTIAQTTDNALGGAGIAFRTKLMPIKVLSGAGWGSSQDVADGIRWAADHGAQVINMSLGGSASSKVQEDAIAHARSKGVTVIAASGNDSAHRVSYPAATEGVIGVGASDPDDKKASFSNYGPEVDIAAPGVNVTQQTICEEGKNGCEQFATWNGTSMATPHVAGVAALIVSLGVSDPDQVEKILKDNAKHTKATEADPEKYGAGILDAGATVRNTVVKQAATRIGLIFGLMFLLGMLRRDMDKINPWKLKFVALAFLAGVGLFFLPMFMPVANSMMFHLTRPMVELDMVWGAGMHRWLPLASILVPGGLTVLLWHLKAMRVPLAGLATGIAAYLGSLLLLGGNWNPLGLVFTGWMVLNAGLCVALARFHLLNADVNVDKEGVK